MWYGSFPELRYTLITPFDCLPCLVRHRFEPKTATFALRYSGQPWRYFPCKVLTVALQVPYTANLSHPVRFDIYLSVSKLVAVKDSLKISRRPHRLGWWERSPVVVCRFFFFWWHCCLRNRFQLYCGGLITVIVKPTLSLLLFILFRRCFICLVSSSGNSSCCFNGGRPPLFSLYILLLVAYFLFSA